MRITRSRLRMIIREELNRPTSERAESFVPEDPGSMIRAQQLLQMAEESTEQPTGMEVEAQGIRDERRLEQGAKAQIQRMFRNMRSAGKQAGQEPAVEVLISSIETDWADFSLETKLKFVEDIQWDIPITSWHSRGPDWPPAPQGPPPPP